MDEDEIMLADEEDIDGAPAITRTYRMDFDKKRVVGMVDGQEAARQSIVKALQTKRFAYMIYDDQYGCDIFNKIGNADLTQEYLESDIPAMIEDMLIVDDMVEGIESIDFAMVDRNSLRIDLYCRTIYGGVSIEGVVDDE